MSTPVLAVRGARLWPDGRLAAGVVVALDRLVGAGWHVLLTDGDDPVLRGVLASQGVNLLTLDDVPALVRGDTDWARSRRLDEESALAMLDLAAEPFAGWATLASTLLDAPRRATVVRATKETRITASVDLDATGRVSINSGLGFFDHMLDQLAKHGGFALLLECAGDLDVDEHHTIEDTGLAIGQALREALGTKDGIGRYGFTVVMDEARGDAGIDFSGRPWCEFSCDFDRDMVGDVPTEMVAHFWHSFAQAAGATLHLAVTGGNDHHRMEAGFKAVARAVRMAIARTGDGLPSTKGVL